MNAPVDAAVLGLCPELLALVTLAFGGWGVSCPADSLDGATSSRRDADLTGGKGLAAR